MLRWDLCDYSDAYIVVKGRINVTGTDNANRKKNLILKNNALFSSWITKINNSLIDNAEDLDIAMPIYNLFEYKDNYSMTSETFWNYCWDEVNDEANENNSAGIYRRHNSKFTRSKLFEFETKIINNREHTR